MNDLIASTRQCGDCTLCCKMLYVSVYESPIGEYCKHCIPDNSCSIHEERHTLCRTFDCLWIKQTQIPESYRPDRCHVLFELPSHSLVYWAHVDDDYPDAYKTDEVQKIIRKINEAGHAVVMNNGGFYLPEGMTPEQLMNDLNHTATKHYEQGTLQLWQQQV